MKKGFALGRPYRQQRMAGNAGRSVLDVSDADGTSLEKFEAFGLPKETAALSALPEEVGVLGVHIEQGLVLESEISPSAW